jgi:hypothetical protein
MTTGSSTDETRQTELASCECNGFTVRRLEPEVRTDAA